MKILFVLTSYLILFSCYSFSYESVINYKYLVTVTNDETIDTLIFKKHIPGNEDFDRSFNILYQLENNKEIKNHYEFLKVNKMNLK